MTNDAIFEAVIAHFGGSSAKFAAAMGESTPAVCNWRSRGIPANRCKKVEELTGISVRKLRPADWADFWPEAKARKPAKVPA